MTECDDRDTRQAARRMNAAGFPRDKRVDEFDFAANPNVPAATVDQLVGCGWVKAGQPLCLIGDSGTGKTHLLIALGTAAVHAGHSVRYVLASKLVNELVEAVDDKQRPRRSSLRPRRSPHLRRARIPRAGPPRGRAAVPGPHRAGGEIGHRDRLQRAVLRLDQDLHRPRLCAAIVDWLTFNGQIIRNRHHQLPTRPRPSSESGPTDAPVAALAAQQRPCLRSARGFGNDRRHVPRSIRLRRPSPAGDRDRSRTAAGGGVRAADPQRSAASERGPG